MIWKILVTILTLDFLYRICRYGKWEVQHFRRLFTRQDALQSNMEKEK